MAIMGDILSAAGFGIDTMLALTGDHPVVGDCKNSKPVYDLDSVGILKMLTKMEQTGCDCGGNEIAGGAPKFYKGAPVTPLYEPMFLQINKLRQKVEAGAMYIQTQGIFDLDVLKRFLEAVDKAGIKTHIMAGIIPLKGAGGAKYMNANVPGICVPQDMIDKLEAAAAEGKAKGIKRALAATAAYVARVAVRPEEQYMLIVHSNREEYAMQLKTLIEQAASPMRVFVSDSFSASGTNIGPGMIGVYFLGEPITADCAGEKEILTGVLESCR
jgi:5,10-methylenetetrahydrofolate reductase